MDYPMRSDLKVGSLFPDFELPDQEGVPRKLSSLLRGFPGVLIFGRGYFCPKDRRQLTGYVAERSSARDSISSNSARARSLSNSGVRV